MTQICVFRTRLFSLHNTLNYAIHSASLRMVLLTDVYRNLTLLYLLYKGPTMLPAYGRQHRRCVIPQAVTHILVLMKMGKIISRNMLS